MSEQEQKQEQKGRASKTRVIRIKRRRDDPQLETILVDEERGQREYLQQCKKHASVTAVTSLLEASAIHAEEEEKKKKQQEQQEQHQKQTVFKLVATVSNSQAKQTQRIDMFKKGSLSSSGHKETRRERLADRVHANRRQRGEQWRAKYAVVHKTNKEAKTETDQEHEHDPPLPQVQMADPTTRTTTTSTTTTTAKATASNKTPRYTLQTILDNIAQQRNKRLGVKAEQQQQNENDDDDEEEEDRDEDSSFDVIDIVVAKEVMPTASEAHMQMLAEYLQAKEPITQTQTQTNTPSTMDEDEFVYDIYIVDEDDHHSVEELHDGSSGVVADLTSVVFQYEEDEDVFEQGYVSFGEEQGSDSDSNVENYYKNDYPDEDQRFSSGDDAYDDDDDRSYDYDEDGVDDDDYDNYL